MTDIQPVVRIALRYLAMLLMTKGYLSDAAGAALLDPAMMTAISGAVIGLGTEIWYWAAKRGNGPT